MIAPLKRALSERRPRTHLEAYVAKHLIHHDPAGNAAAERPSRRMSCPGIEFDLDGHVSQLRRWEANPAIADVIGRVRRDPTINTATLGSAVHNGFYASPDIEVLLATIIDTAPPRIVEIGSGYSTRAMRVAIDSTEMSTELIAIDPEPRAGIDRVADLHISERVEHTPVDRLVELLVAGSILFVDSSHIAASGGDVEFVFGEVIPRLRSGVIVHVDDIYLPYQYPNVARERCWTEQPVLAAMLSNSPRYQVRFATHWIARERPAAVESALGMQLSPTDHVGASLWFDVI